MAAILALVIAVPTPVTLDGYATWYDAPSGHFAAGPAVRAALGAGWRGSTVSVTVGGKTITGRLLDWCACGKRHAVDTLLDLPTGDFARLASLGSGVIHVSVRLGTEPISPPATDADRLARPRGAMVPS